MATPCQETRTLVTFSLIFFTIDAPPFLSLATFPLYVLPNRPPFSSLLCVHRGQFFNVGPLTDHGFIQT